MAFLILIGNLIGLVACATFIWLLVIAFKRSLGWGLAVFFLSPIAAIVFAIKYWEESRKPFLIHTGCLVSIFLIVILVAARGGAFGFFEMARDIERGEMSQEQAAGHMMKTLDNREDAGFIDGNERATAGKMREMLGEMRDGGSASRERAPSSRPSDDRGGNYDPSGYTKVSVRGAFRHVGSPVRVVEKDGLRYRGTLTGARGETLYVERQIGGGSVTLEVSKAEVESIEVYRR